MAAVDVASKGKWAEEEGDDKWAHASVTWGEDAMKYTYLYMSALSPSSLHMYSLDFFFASK